MSIERSLTEPKTRHTDIIINSGQVFGDEPFVVGPVSRRTIVHRTMGRVTARERFFLTLTDEPTGGVFAVKRSKLAVLTVTSCIVN